MGNSYRAILVLTLGILVPCGCGGGGGGAGGGGNGAFSLADIVGSWQGPTGTATVAGGIGLAAGPTGMVVDASGDVVGAGAAIREGTVSLTSATQGIYRYVGTGPSAGQISMLIMSADKGHLLWVANDLEFGAWERDAAAFAPPYDDADVRDLVWTGLAAEATATMNPLDPETIFVSIDAAGNFAADTSSTNVAPITLTDADKGVYRGDFIDPGPPEETGNLVVLITPDKQFVAIFSCLTGGTFPDDCSYAALSR